MKLYSLCLSVFCLFTLSSCGGGNDSESIPGSERVAPEAVMGTIYHMTLKDVLFRSKEVCVEIIDDVTAQIDGEIGSYTYTKTGTNTATLLLSYASGGSTRTLTCNLTFMATAKGSVTRWTMESNRVTARGTGSFIQIPSMPSDFSNSEFVCNACTRGNVGFYGCTDFRCSNFGQSPFFSP